MRCKACDRLLSEYESTRKSATSGEFVDLCNPCYSYVKEDIQVIENQENLTFQDYIDLEDDLC